MDLVCCAQQNDWYICSRNILMTDKKIMDSSIPESPNKYNHWGIIICILSHAENVTYKEDSIKH